MTASRLEKIKGVDILVDIFIQYLESHPGTLLIVGDGGLRKDVENKIAQHDLKKRILEHNQGLNFSTKSKRPWYLIYYEACVNEKDVKAREKYLKSGMGKRYIKNRLKFFFSN
jgi:putative endonuclease